MADKPAFARRFGKAVDHALSMLRERRKVNLQTVPKTEMPAGQTHSCSVVAFVPDLDYGFQPLPRDLK